MAIANANNELGNVTYPAGTRVFSDSETSQIIYFIQSGTVRISKVVASQEVTVEVLGKGEFFGGSALLANQPRTTNATALTELEVVQVDASKFDDLVKKSPEIGVRLAKQLSARLAEAQFRLANFTLRTNRGRLISQLRHEAEIHDPTGKKGAPIPTDFAEILGIEVREAKEIISDLVNDGFITINDKGFFQIKDKLAFQRYLDYLELRDRFEYKKAK